MPPTRSSTDDTLAACPITLDDLRDFHAGRHRRIQDRLGAHRLRSDGAEGYGFGVWAPAARAVSVVGDFNDWNPARHRLQPLGRGGVWWGFVSGVEESATYKFHIESRERGYRVDKADPFARRAEEPPATASIVCDLEYAWTDGEWMERRGAHSADDAPMSIYELHMGSWRRASPELVPDYESLGDSLIPYLLETGFTHVELLPPMEHPFYGSWGYQTTGYFAPTARYGHPRELMRLIDRLHGAGIGVVLDWVPSHFPGDEHGLGFFDGTRLFEYADPRVGYHPDWKSYIFDYGRNEVRSFLVSSALFWLERYHVDALRVDAVASMLYLDYSRAEGEWVANKYGGRENLEAIEFLRRLNDAVHEEVPDARTIAEESTAWPLVTRPAYLGGLGFDMKWDMGWMHDTLEYFKLDPVHRRFHHDSLTFRTMYAWSEHFVLPLSHDEVVHGKRSLLEKMHGDYWQKFAHQRALYGYMYGQPGKKLLFMGGELGHWREWDHERELDWNLLDYPHHQGLQRWVAELNRLYRDEPALHALDFDPRGFSWIDCADAEQSVLSFARHGRDAETLLVVCNFTPVPRHGYRIGVPRAGAWRERLNSDAEIFGGSGVGNPGELVAVPIAYHGRDWSLVLTLPPLAVCFLEPLAPPVAAAAENADDGTDDAEDADDAEDDGGDGEGAGGA
jgi:1,4-alpha-glucan branching enzyme